MFLLNSKWHWFSWRTLLKMLLSNIIFFYSNVIFYILITSSLVQFLFRRHDFVILLLLFHFLHFLVFKTVECLKFFICQSFLCHIFCLILGFSLFFLTFKRSLRLLYYNYHKFIFMLVLITDVS